jgi:hypothetical protein
MSTDYFIINKRISKKEITDNTDLTIRSQDNGEWIVDKYNNGMLIVEGFYGMDENGERKEIKDDIIRELSRYGVNNPKYILDTLGRKFNLLWIDDDSKEYFYHLKEGELTQDQINDKYEEFVIEDMGKIGHKIIDYVNSIVEVPERLEEEYLPEKSEPSKPLPPIGSMDQTYLSNLGNNDEDLPF